MPKLIEVIVIKKVFHAIKYNADGTGDHIEVQPGEKCKVTARTLESFPDNLVMPAVFEAQQAAEKIKNEALADIRNAEVAAKTGAEVKSTNPNPKPNAAAK